MGLSGGILVLWNSSVFLGEVVEAKPYAITIDFTACHDRRNGVSPPFMGLAMSPYALNLFVGCVTLTSVGLLFGFLWEISTFIVLCKIAIGRVAT